MKRLGRILLAGAVTFWMSGTALAQAAPPAHQQHEQAPAAAPPALPDQQHQQQGPDRPGEHGMGCQCPCCRTMMEMMQRHGPHQPGADPGQADDHQQHQADRPN